MAESDNCQLVILKLLQTSFKSSLVQTNLKLNLYRITVLNITLVQMGQKPT